MTSEKIISPVTFATLMTLALPVSYCELALRLELGGIAFCTDYMPCGLNTVIQLNTGYS